MKVFILIALMLPTMLIAQQTYVPDDNFEQALIDMGLDEGPLDDYVPTENIDTVMSLNIISKGIIDLTGISDFADIVHINCSNNNLINLDLKDNVNLKEIYCQNNYSIQQIDLSQNINLEIANFYWNGLATIELPKSSIRILDLSHNNFEILDVRNCEKLEKLNCRSSHILSLILSECTSLKYLDCHYNELINLDVNSCKSLERLICNNNSISDLLLSECTSLKYLDCEYNDLKSLDVSSCISLDTLECNGNDLTNLIVAGSYNLDFLSCSYNDLESLDVSNCNNLDDLWCNYNSLKNLNLNGCIRLRGLMCKKNEFSELDLTTCKSLEFIKCNYNKLTKLDVSKNSQLVSIYCQDNLLTELDISYNVNLHTLICSNNLLLKLNLKNGNYKKLYEMYAESNKDLVCIQVDSLDLPFLSYQWSKDKHAHYSEDCGYTSVTEEPLFTFSISPNPATDFIYIESESLNTEIEIYNMLGISVLKTIGSGQIDVSWLPRGIYFVKIDEQTYKKLILH